MATEIVTRIRDDLDRTIIEDGQGVRVQFWYDGKTYQLDLTHINAKKFHEQMQFWVDKACPVPGKKLPEPTRVHGSANIAFERTVHATKGSSQSRRGIRKWARDNGYDIGDKGQVPREITAAFDLAHSA